MGRRRIRLASTAAWKQIPALRLKLGGKLHDQDRILGREAHQHHETDLGQDVHIRTVRPHAQDRGQKAHRHNEDDGERHAPALILRSQREIHEQNRKAEDDNGRRSLVRLLIGKVRPLVADAVRENARGKVAHDLDAFARADARRAGALHLDRGIKIVPRHALRPCDFAEGGEAKPSGTIAPFALRTFNCAIFAWSMR